MTTQPLRRDQAELKRAVARVARLYSRPKPPTAEAEADARRDLALVKLSCFIGDTLDAAPPLLPEQRAELVALLMGA